MKKGESSNTEVKNISLKKKTNMNSFTQNLFFIYTEPAEEDTGHRNKTKIKKKTKKKKNPT